MNKIQIIVNNGAGTGSAVAVWKETKEYLQENGISYNAYLTRYEKHAVNLWKDSGRTHLSAGGRGRRNYQ